ncbi:MAG: Hsp20/alpha crystallin family protein [Planctomycetaceae bacterium]|nr:Hsp20/alpha crystallin family protein [Planctomycetaceae bacterium]
MTESQQEQNELDPPEQSSSGHQLSIRRETPDSVLEQSQSESDQAPGSVRIVSESESPVKEPQRPLFSPPIDIFGTDDGLVLRADLPGVCVERLDLQIEDNKLTLFGRVQENLPEDVQPLHQEYQVGDFYRSFILSDEVDYERITAKMNLGVLEITLPIIPRAKPRKIHVQAE